MPPVIRTGIFIVHQTKARVGTPTAAPDSTTPTTSPDPSTHTIPTLLPLLPLLLLPLTLSLIPFQPSYPSYHFCYCSCSPAGAAPTTAEHLLLVLPFLLKTLSTRPPPPHTHYGFTPAPLELTKSSQARQKSYNRGSTRKVVRVT